MQSNGVYCQILHYWILISISRNVHVYSPRDEIILMYEIFMRKLIDRRPGYPSAHYNWADLKLSRIADVRKMSYAVLVSVVYPE